MGQDRVSHHRRSGTSVTATRARSRLPRLRAIKRKLLYSTVQSELKSYIVKHRLRPGDPLPSEAELSRQFGIGRNSVREAVKSLEVLGVVESRMGSGLFVRDFSFDPILDNLPYGMLFDRKQLSDILEVRLHLETGMVERVITSSTPDHVRELRGLLRRWAKLAERGEYPAEYDRAFHLAMHRNVDNPLLTKILDSFWRVFHDAQARASVPEPIDPLETHRHHLLVLDALEARDVDGMRRALIRHHQGIQDRLRSAAGPHDDSATGALDDARSLSIGSALE